MRLSALFEPEGGATALFSERLRALAPASAPTPPLAVFVRNEGLSAAPPQVSQSGGHYRQANGYVAESGGFGVVPERPAKGRQDGSRGSPFTARPPAILTFRRFNSETAFFYDVS